MRSKLSEFKFDLPKELVAQYPSDERDESRLMVVHRDTGKIEHKLFKDVLDYFGEGDTMIFNNTKVFPARLYGIKEKTGALIEVFLLRELNAESKLWDVMVDPARKIRVGNKLIFTTPDSNIELMAEVMDNTTSRGRTLRFFYEGEDEIPFMDVINELGKTPLPKYINRPVEAFDRDRYQTVFAKEVGAVAAPTAGLHFSRQLLKRLEINGVDLTEVTLHVGMGTFRTIDVEDLSKHKMEAEYFKITEDTVEKVNNSMAAEKKICAVGTTVMRSLESAVSAQNTLNPAKGWTNKFIFPPYEFKIANSLITNFHLPLSSLFIMISAFAGKEFMREVYQEAIKEKYKFYSYGDAMLIL
ncbi:MAG TPA: tRNA preQ1(34) S-adenosylmethionine ribosyltransferase-isomerase QueA [Saprospiraceae bacterium]|nr:tRNA preQ1(34) S-adenosylmethionine ribosyltransferase-isomerase QueA [Saprospiraceae bacterium]